MNNLHTVCPKCNYKYDIPLDKELIRTLPQNNLYWGVYIKIIAEQTGMFPDDLHTELKLKFNPKDSKFNPGEKIGATTTKMTRKEFTKYLDDIRLWANSFLGIDLPEADNERKREP